jgi:hypothetical protein
LVVVAFALTLALSTACSADSFAAHSLSAATSGKFLRKQKALKLSPSGLGPIRFGMKPAQASRALGARISVEDGIYSCTFWKIPGTRRGAQVIALKVRLAYVLLYERGIATTRGVKVGDSLSRLRRRYRGKLHRGRSASLSGADRRLFVSKHENGTTYELEFDIDGGHIAFISAATRHVLETFGECS